jgi:hypothetical protein
MHRVDAREPGPYHHDIQVGHLRFLLWNVLRP